MHIGPDSFIHWAKTHCCARYELTLSGVPPIDEAAYGRPTDRVRMTIEHPYGDPELIRLIADRYGVADEDVLPVTGTSTANFLAMACAAERGRRILIESPGYEPISRVAHFLGLTVETFQRDPGSAFLPDMAQIRNGLSRGAKAVVLTDLHNPSGCRCPDDVLAEAADACAASSAFLIVDEVYRDFSHINGDRSLGSCRVLGPHVMTTGSLTKVYGFGGLRVGWLTADPAVIGQARDVFDGMSVDLPAPSSDLAIRILGDIERFAERTRRLYQESFPIYDEWVRSREELIAYPNHGAIFGYCHLPERWSADAFCEFLRERFDTAVVPGAFFGAPDHIRIGFGLPPEELAEALSRVGEALGAFRR